MRRPAYVKQRRRLDRKITFLRAGAERNAMNEPTSEFAPLFVTRCAAYPSPGFERIENAQEVAVVPILVEVLPEVRTKDLKETDRFTLDGSDRMYNIISVEQPDRGGRLRIVGAVML